MVSHICYNYLQCKHEHVFSGILGYDFYIFRGHMAIQVFGWAIWFFGRPCGHLVSQGSCAHLALKKDIWLPSPLKGHVSIWPFEGPCGHLAL